MAEKIKPYANFIEEKPIFLTRDILIHKKIIITTLVTSLRYAYIFFIKKGTWFTIQSCYTYSFTPRIIDLQPCNTPIHIFCLFYTFHLHLILFISSVYLTAILHVVYLLDP